jgi:hypothetical protein
MSENIPSRQESERRCLHWTPANKASISVYMHRMHAEQWYLPWTRWLGRLMYATIEQRECLNCRRCLPYANWNVKVDRSYNSIQFTPLLMVNKQNIADIKRPHHPLIFTLFFLSCVYIYTAGSFLHILMCTNNFLLWYIYTKKKKKKNVESTSIRWFHFLMKGVIKEERE